jgi:hypothetical protein
MMGAKPRTYYREGRKTGWTPRAADSTKGYSSQGVKSSDFF